MIHAHVPPEAWAAEGARTAEALNEVASALVIACDPEAATHEASGPVLAAANGTRATGLLDCVRDGLPISEHARWPRLVAGFREVDALRLIVVAANAPGLNTLVRAAVGVVALALPPVLSRTFPLLATLDRPEPEPLPVAPLPDRPPTRSRRPTRRRARPTRSPWAPLSTPPTRRMAQDSPSNS